MYRGTTDIDPTLSYWTVQSESPRGTDQPSKSTAPQHVSACLCLCVADSWGPTWGEEGYFKMVWDFTDEFNVTHSSCGVGKVRKRHFLSHLYIKINILPRQARDEHRENSKKVPFSLRVLSRGCRTCPSECLS
jgi:hypothetical protein